jgi:hypothetical protein
MASSRLKHALYLAGVLLAASVVPSAVEASIRRTPGAWLYGPDAVFSDGTTSPMFVPLSDPLASAGLLNARVSTELVATSGFCKVRPALRWSDDGVVWGASSSIVASYRSTVGIDYGSSYLDLNVLGTPKPWVQFGVEVANVSGTRVEVCQASVMVEPKEK